MLNNTIHYSPGNSMVNERLLQYLENKKMLRKYQCGGKRHRSTNEHLIRMESSIRNAFVRNEHLIAVSFDMEEAYDMTWRYGVMQDLHGCGVGGRMATFIENFFRNRVFRVRINMCLSGSMRQENGVTQGSILSPTLYILKINNIIQNLQLNSKLQASLYMDDLMLTYSDLDLGRAGQALQISINKIALWSENNGFKFSPTKTVAVHFSDKPGLFLPPPLRLNGQSIQYSDCCKFLGLLWDRKLLWKQHVAELKKRCIKAMNILKTISAIDWGADQESILRIYKALVRSRIDYGAIVYCSAAPSTLKTLEPIANEAMRLATGAFKSSPIASLQVLCNESSLDQRRQAMSCLRYNFKMRSYIDSPVFQHIVNNIVTRDFLRVKKTILSSFTTSKLQSYEFIQVKTMKDRNYPLGSWYVTVCLYAETKRKNKRKEPNLLRGTS